MAWKIEEVGKKVKKNPAFWVVGGILAVGAGMYILGQKGKSEEKESEAEVTTPIAPSYMGGFYPESPGGDTDTILALVGERMATFQEDIQSELDKKFEEQDEKTALFESQITDTFSSQLETLSSQQRTSLESLLAQQEKQSNQFMKSLQKLEDKVNAAKAPAPAPAAKAPAPAPAAKAPAKTATTKTYTVKSGDNLWNIAGKKEIYNDPTKWRKIYEANKGKIKNPDLIYPGQVFVIPA